MKNKRESFVKLITKARYYNNAVKLIQRYQLFDEDFYRNQIVGLKNEPKEELIEHYLKYGWKQSLNPCVDFNTKFYLEQNQDVFEGGENPLMHYIVYGHKEGRKPSANADFYTEWARFEKNEHSIVKLFKECICMYHIYKSHLFQGEYYISNYVDVQKELKKKYAWRLREQKNGLLKMIGRISTTPIRHYVKHGVYEGRNPNSMFDTRYYLNEYQDITQGGYTNPLEHYCLYGATEGRSTREMVDVENNELATYIRHQRETKQKNDFISDRSLSVILPYDGDMEEMTRRIHCVLKQGRAVSNLLILNSTKQERQEVFQQVEEILNEQSEVKLSVIGEKACEKTLEDAIRQVTTEYVWILEKNHSVHEEFVKLLLPELDIPDVCIVDCKKGVSNTSSMKEQFQGATKNFECFYYTRGKQVISILNRQQEVGFSNIIMRNPALCNWFLDQQWNLESSYGTKRFFLNYSKYGFFAHTRRKLCYQKKLVHKENTNTNWTETVKLHFQYLEDLYLMYHVNPQIIQDKYEAMRTKYLSNTGQSIEEFEKLEPIHKLLCQKKTSIAMISLYAFSHGGGEIMPIRLANQLHKMGVQVYVHSYVKENMEVKVRALLDPEIPVFETNQETELVAIIDCMGVEVLHTHHQSLQTFWASVLSMYPDLKQTINHVATSHGMYEAFDEEIIEYLLKHQLPGTVDEWTYVADKNIEPFKKCKVYDSDHFHKISNGMERPKKGTIRREDLMIPEDAFVFCLASRAMKEKGWLEAMECVKNIQQSVEKQVHLILIGDGPLYQKLKTKEMPKYLHLLGFRDNPCDYYQISDACVLLSTYASESAPLTIIEALMSGVPVIATNLGDIEQMLTYETMVAGEVIILDHGKVPIQSVEQSMIRMVNDSNIYQQYRRIAQKKSVEFEIENVAKKYLEVYAKKKLDSNDFTLSKHINDEIQNTNRMLLDAYQGKNTKKVSVIVPNYNHARFLRQRLDCIYHQTYQNIEVLLLDDCSSDESREILREYAQKYKDKTRLLFNEKNSGGVFHQWSKGIKAATGEICWIAESDDYCDYDLIEKLIPAFEDSDVKISYAHYQFVNQENQPKEFTFEHYIGEVDPNKWMKSYINDSNSEVNEALYLINSIPNASGALFKNPGSLALFKEKQWLDMKICGDWIFYLYVIYGGKISYSIATTSYFRFHDSNSSATTYVRPTYCVEHEYVAKTLRRLYGVDDEKIQELYRKIQRFYQENVKQPTKKFEELFHIQEILVIEKEKVEL